ncbi:MAG TPA: hypothetical protein VJ327_11185, partial [Patescibacteria group bacterium]|nr:hypothetical protein [Patescibacteria group bacterium]
PDLKAGFQGLSTTKKLFRVGERAKAIEFITNWLRSNAREYVKICDPYFDEEQLWILQSVPLDIEVKIVTTGKKLGLPPRNDHLDNLTPIVIRERQKDERKRLQSLFTKAWNELSNQAPPATLVVLHETIFDTAEKDDFHDRYLITKEAGLSIGTSLNGFGNQEFLITILSRPS